MNLKPLVASLALLASGAALAAGFTPPEPAPAAVERLELTRNHNGRFAESDWFRRITISGEVNVDALASSKSRLVETDLPVSFNEPVPNDVGFDSEGLVVPVGLIAPTRFAKGSGSDIGVSDANIYLGAEINDWFMANVDLKYNDSIDGGELKTNYRQSFVEQDPNTDTLDEAYLTIGNFRQSPVYLLLGKEYIPYGYYVRHPVMAPFTQLMTQTNATAAQLGFIDASGFNGSIFAFRNKQPRHAFAPVRIENGGAQIGYRYDQRDMGINVDVSYLANMNDVDYLTSLQTFDNAFYYPDSTAVQGVSAIIAGHYMGFDAQIQYAGALDRFDPSVMQWSRVNDNGLVDTLHGAKPRSYMVGIGYAFPVMNHDSRIGLSYNHSMQAVGFGNSNGMPGLPRYRWQGDYTVNVAKNVDVTLAVSYDKDYSARKVGSTTIDENLNNNVPFGQGTGRSSTTGAIRVAARFA